MPMSPRLLRPRQGGDPDALRYIAAVQAADGQPLESGVRKAINDFVVGCKADGIWSAIKASCILAGARTLAGALTPLVGTAPTNFNFVSGDYNRKTGLVGNASTKYLDSNRPNNADPRDNNHNAVYATTIATAGVFLAANGSPDVLGTNILQGGSGGGFLVTRNRSNAAFTASNVPVAGLIGASRSQGASYVMRNGGVEQTISTASDGHDATNVVLFRRMGGSANYSAHRLAFYSIGTNLNLALLDSRVTALINAIGTAIP